jgi:methylmalonyl-CoA carboxyltransferase large subunit
MSYSGVVHFVAEDDEDAVRICQKLLSFLPANNLEDPPKFAPESEEIQLDESINHVIPDDPKQAYDMHEVIRRIVDDGDYLEVQATFAQNMIVAFGRIRGRTVGIIANQPQVKAGCLDIDAADKSSRFIRFCNAFNIPLVTLVDVPGFMPGVEQEYGGIIRHGAKMLFVYSAATVPKISVVLRKAYGGAYLAMCGKALGADRVAAWPSAEIAVMGAEGAANVVFRREIEAAEDKESKRQELIEEYRRTFSTPYVAGARRMIDDIIEPADTRRYLAMALEMLQTKRDQRPAKKHGLMPL